MLERSLGIFRSVQRVRDMGIASKHPMLTARFLIPVVIATGVLLLFAPAAYQNYQGVCRAEGRVLTDEELIHRFIDAELNNSSTPALMAVTFPDGRTRDVYRIFDRSYEEFMKYNPDCCKIYQDPPNVPIGEQLTGRARKSFFIRGFIRYREADGTEGSFMTDYGEPVVLTNCGKSTFN